MMIIHSAEVVFVTLQERPLLIAVCLMNWTAQAKERLREERGDLSVYLAQGVLALAAVSLTGIILFAFTSVGQHLKDIVDTWVGVPISTGISTSTGG